MNDFPPNEPFKTPGSSPTKLASEIDSEQRTWALGAHLSPLLGFVVPVPFFNILAPVIVWFLKRETMPFVDDQAKEAINFQITVLIAAFISGVLTLVIIGFFLLVAVIIYSLVMMVLAAKAAQEGKHYRYPICLRLI